MTVCKDCKNDMLDPSVKTCIGNIVIIFPDGAESKPVPHSGSDLCRDCNVPPGGNHHPGCDAERCPKCKGQLIRCSYGTASPPNCEYKDAPKWIEGKDEKCETC